MKLVIAALTLTVLFATGIEASANTLHSAIEQFKNSESKKIKETFESNSEEKYEVLINPDEKNNGQELGVLYSRLDDYEKKPFIKIIVDIFQAQGYKTENIHYDNRTVEITLRKP